MYDFFDSDSGHIFIADPPSGVPLEAPLARMLSWRLRSPVPLPLESVLAFFGAPGRSTQQESFFLHAHVTGLTR